MIKVNPRARRHEDRAGDPLDGLVNLFDLGIVLAVAFLLAALSSLQPRPVRCTQPCLTPPARQITVRSPGPRSAPSRPRPRGRSGAVSRSARSTGSTTAG